MRIHASLTRCFAGFLLIMALAGCATSARRSRILNHLESGGSTNLMAYLSGTNLQLRFPVRGGDVYARASWAESPAGAIASGHQFAVLNFEKPERAARRSVAKRGNRLAVRDGRQWQQLVHGIFQELVPNEPGHGVLLLVQNQDMVVFRDQSRRLNVAKLESKPPEVVVDHKFDDAEFSRQAVQWLQANAHTPAGKEGQFLFVTGEDPAFVLIDLRQRLIVFLSYPTDPETAPMEVPGWFAVRALNSLLINSLVVAAIKNPFTLVGRGLWHIGNSGARMVDVGPSSSTNLPPPLYTGAGMDLAEWEARLDKLVYGRPYKGKVDLFINGEKFFPALVQSIQGAGKRIDVEVFIFDTDDYAIKIADLLRERSAKVRVRVLMDEMGSLFAAQSPPSTPEPPDFQPPGDIRSYLKSGSHISVRAAANPWLTVDHRKCIILDSQQAYVGGMNIGREYRYEWHDMMVGLTGPIVGRLEKDYRKAWAHAGLLGDFAYAWVSIFERVNPHRMAFPDGIDIRPLRTATGRTEIYHAQLEAIQRAKRYIYIENAYFDDATILRALVEARRRGVDVRVVLPAENDSGIMQTSNLMMANDMVRNGIRVYAYPGMTHVKAAIYDGWACLGSANFDKMSLRISQELDVAFSDPATVGRLQRELFDADFEHSREMKTPVSLDWLDSFVKALADQL